MRNKRGQFIKGHRSSPATEFKKGEHWRKPQPFRRKSWLVVEYITKQRSTGDIAAQFGVTREAILFWLKKHEIPRRNTSQARKMKHWGAEGEANGMYGRRGSLHPSYAGGNTAWRQAMYSTSEFKQFMRQVWARDRGRCLRCGAGGKLEIHHVLPVRAAPLLLLDHHHACLLCKSCHDLMRNKEHRYRAALMRKIKAKESNDNRKS